MGRSGSVSPPPKSSSWVCSEGGSNSSAVESESSYHKKAGAFGECPSVRRGKQSILTLSKEDSIFAAW